MKKKLNVLIILFFIIILAFNACKDDCPVEPDPCSEYPEKMEIITETERIANGKIYEDLVITNVNEFASGRTIYFSTNFAYDSVLWQIGNEATQRIGSKIRIHFKDAQGPLLIRAIGHREVNYECYGEHDTGIDTLYRRLHFQDWWTSPLFGTYRGTLIGESDSFNVVIGNNPEIKGSFTYYRQDSAYFQVIPKGTTTKSEFIVTLYEIFSQNYSNPIIDEKLTYGRLLPEDRNVLELTYWIKNSRTDLSDLSKFTFKGRRIK
jgi:hypothetical protein